MRRKRPGQGRAGPLPVRYSPRIARWIAEREGGVPDADGSVTTEHPLLDVARRVRLALQDDSDAEVLAPPAVRQELARRLDASIAGLRDDAGADA